MRSRPQEHAACPDIDLVGTVGELARLEDRAAALDLDVLRHIAAVEGPAGVCEGLGVAGNRQLERRKLLAAEQGAVAGTLGREARPGRGRHERGHDETRCRDQCSGNCEGRPTRPSRRRPVERRRGRRSVELERLAPQAGHVRREPADRACERRGLGIVPPGKLGGQPCIAIGRRRVGRCAVRLDPAPPVCLRPEPLGLVGKLDDGGRPCAKALVGAVRGQAVRPAAKLGDLRRAELTPAGRDRRGHVQTLPGHATRARSAGSRAGRGRAEAGRSHAARGGRSQRVTRPRRGRPAAAPRVHTQRGPSPRRTPRGRSPSRSGRPDRSAARPDRGAPAPGRAHRLRPRPRGPPQRRAAARSGRRRR